MRQLPNPEYDDELEDLRRLNAEPWQVELLGMNPEYTSWGPYEDAMMYSGDGWNSRMLLKGWNKNQVGLDELNEVVNFYFEVTRNSHRCDTCEGSGYHPDALWVANSFYSHSSPFTNPTESSLQAAAIMKGFGASISPSNYAAATFPSENVLARYKIEFRLFCEAMKMRGSWHDLITDDEAQVLHEAGRCETMATAEEINVAQSSGRGFCTHDAINRGILIEQRCKRLEIPLTCPDCGGHGYIYSEPSASVNLILWLLHPRKGCSRGVEMKDIQWEDLPEIFDFLREAANRNADRFSKIPEG